jgi:hypothetical protein
MSVIWSLSGWSGRPKRRKHAAEKNANRRKQVREANVCYRGTRADEVIE